ncbi:hypothetical protein EMMF5_006462 [Cystobasidiomycetes sp. EMM_F5]
MPPRITHEICWARPFRKEDQDWLDDEKAERKLLRASHQANYPSDGEEEEVEDNEDEDEDEDEGIPLGYAHNIQGLCVLDVLEADPYE